MFTAIPFYETTKSHFLTHFVFRNQEMASGKSKNTEENAEGNEKRDVGLGFMQEDDEFLKKWSGPILLGPIVPAIFSLIAIMGGHIVLNTWQGYCGYALDGNIYFIYFYVMHSLLLQHLLEWPCLYAIYFS